MASKNDHSLHEKSILCDEVAEQEDWYADHLPLADDGDEEVGQKVGKMRPFPLLVSQRCRESGERSDCCGHFRFLSRDQWLA